jgi:hypothetical protein
LGVSRALRVIGTVCCSKLFLAAHFMRSSTIGKRSALARLFFVSRCDGGHTHAAMFSSASDRANEFLRARS